MVSVRIAEKKVWVDNVSIPLLSGDVHYWRLDPANWHPVLQRAREMGLRVIATYVCWDFHEIEPGRYDFCGETDPRHRPVVCPSFALRPGSGGVCPASLQ